MADAPKTVHGTLVSGVSVQVGEDTAAALGSEFTADKAGAKKAAASKSDK